MNGTDFPLRAIDLERLGISLCFVNTDNEGTRARALANAHLLNASKDLLFALQCCIGSLSVVSPGARCVACQKGSCQGSWRGCMSEWKPIETAPTYEMFGKQMFIVRGFSVQTGAMYPYTTDPWCVWRNADGSFARWPHFFQPTHWSPLPDDPKGA